MDFRDAAERAPITTLRKASPKQYAIPGCGTIRLSKPPWFGGRGEGLAIGPERGTAAGAADPDALHRGRNAWICSAFIEPETEAERAAWRDVLPAGYDAVSPIRRPRAFARALGAMVAEQVGAQGRTLMLRSAVDGQVFRTAHRSQTVYHGAVVYLEDPYRRLESASSVLEFNLLLLFMESAAHRAQREYRFAVWAQDEPGRDRVDLHVSPALLDAMQNPPKAAAGPIGMSARVDERAVIEEVDDHGPPRVQVHVEAPPGSLGTINPIVAPTRCDAERLPDNLRETAAIHAAAEALRAAVDQLDTGSSRDAVAAAWRAEPIVRVLLLDLRRRRYRGARERRQLHRGQGGSSRERAGRGDDRGRTGRHVRVPSQHGPRAGCFRVARSPGVGAGLDEPAGGAGSAGSSRRRPWLTPTLRGRLGSCSRGGDEPPIFAPSPL